MGTQSRGMEPDAEAVFYVRPGRASTVFFKRENVPAALWREQAVVLGFCLVGLVQALHKGGQGIQGQAD